MEKKKKEQNQTYLLLQMPKEIDHYSLLPLRSYADEKIMNEGYRDIIFDFKETSLMDSSGIGMLLGRYRLVKVVGGSVCVVNANERIRSILEAAGITKVINLLN